MVQASVLKDGASKSLELYGSSVYWQSDADLSTIINADGTANLEGGETSE